MGFTAVNSLPPAKQANEPPDDADARRLGVRKRPRLSILSECGPLLLSSEKTPAEAVEGANGDAKPAARPKTTNSRFTVPAFGESKSKPNALSERRSLLPGLSWGPEVHPSGPNIRDLPAVIASVEGLGNYHGVVKATIPASQENATTFDWDEVSYRLVRQRINISSDLETVLASQFVLVLDHFHANQPKPIKLYKLMLDKQEIDLYAFHMAVLRRGGYTNVGRHHLWQPVFDAMGLAFELNKTGKMRRFYSRFINPFVVFLAANGLSLTAQARPLLFEVGRGSTMLPHNIGVSPAPADMPFTLSSDPLPGTMRLRSYASCPPLSLMDDADKQIATTEAAFWKDLETQALSLQRGEYAADPGTLPALPLPGETPTNSPQDSALRLLDLTYSPWSTFRYMHEDVHEAPLVEIALQYAVTPWHSPAPSVIGASLVHYGAARTWYVVPASARDKALPLLKGNLMPPHALAAAGVPVYTVDQMPGDFVFIFPGALAACFDHGFNLVERTLFRPLWSGVGGIAAAGVCVERLLYNIVTHSVTMSQLEAMRKEVQALLDVTAAAWQFVGERGLPVKRHTGSLTVATETGEQKYLLWIEHDGTVYDVAEYRRRELEGGCAVAHAKLEDMLAEIRTKLQPADTSALDLLTGGVWRIEEFVKAAAVSPLPELHALGRLLNTRFPNGAAWLEFSQGTELGNLTQLMGYFVGMPPYPAADKRVVNVVKAVRKLRCEIQQVTSQLEQNLMTVDVALPQLRNMEEAAMAPEIAGVTADERAFLSRLRVLLDWTHRYNALAAALAEKGILGLSHSFICEIDALFANVPDPRLIMQGAAVSTNRLYRSRLQLGEWVRKFHRYNNNVDEFTRQELDQVRFIIGRTPVDKTARDEITSVLTAADYALATINPSRLRPRLSAARRYARYSHLLRNAVAVCEHFIAQVPIRQLLSDASTDPSRINIAVSALLPALHLKVVPEEIEEIVTLVSVQFRREQTSWTVPLPPDVSFVPGAPPPGSK